MPPKIHKLVLTGGPCAGKTAMLKSIETFFKNLDWKVCSVPECASLLLKWDKPFYDLKDEQKYEILKDVIMFTMDMQEQIVNSVQSIEKNVLIIYDRGTIDALAYLPRDKWQQMLLENNWSYSDLRDSRYDQVIHLVSTAIGAKANYKIDNHKFRPHNIELARELDNATATAWQNHACFDIIDNSTDFRGKLWRVIEIICHELGIDPKQTSLEHLCVECAYILQRIPVGH